jgi:hypothetical protein
MQAWYFLIRKDVKGLHFAKSHHSFLMSVRLIKDMEG